MKFKKNKGQKILEQVAQQNGVSVEEVRNEIRQAIEIGILNPDPEIQSKWMSMRKNGVTPTPEELIIYISKQLN